MAMAGGTRTMVGRTTTFTAMAAISSSSSCYLRSSSSSSSPTILSCRPPPAPGTACLASSCNASSTLAAFPSRMLLMRCQRWQISSWKAAPSRPLPSSSVLMSSSSSSSSSVTSVDTSGEQPPLSSSSSAPAPSGESSSAAAAAVVVETAEVDALDIRVGRVLKAWKHPEADSLFVEEVDLAEPEGPRTICSGLVNYLSLEELQGKAVLVLANLKARNMRGVKSNGMLLAASNAEHTIVQLLSPPERAVPGERVWFGEATDQGSQSAAGTPNQVQKKKIWESVQPLLKTTEDCVATFQSRPMRTSEGVVTCQSLQGANIS